MNKKCPFSLDETTTNMNLFNKYQTLNMGKYKLKEM